MHSEEEARRKEEEAKRERDRIIALQNRADTILEDFCISYVQSTFRDF